MDCGQGNPQDGQCNCNAGTYDGTTKTCTCFSNARYDTQANNCQCINGVAPDNKSCNEGTPAAPQEGVPEWLYLSTIIVGSIAALAIIYTVVKAWRDRQRAGVAPAPPPPPMAILLAPAPGPPPPPPQGGFGPWIVGAAEEDANNGGADNGRVTTTAGNPTVLRTTTSNSITQEEIDALMRSNEVRMPSGGARTSFGPELGWV
jgi:hypothetical protein